MTAEDPVEFSIDGVGQVQIKEKIGLTFSAVLRSFLRQDPEVIMIGEIRDKETVDIAVKSALTGHLVLSTLHTNDSVSSISRLLNMGVPPYLVSSALTLVVAQRLVRVVCPDCKAKDSSVAIGELQGIGFSKDEASTVTLYNGEGCSSCNGLGVKGRRGLYEVLRITNNIKEGILLNKTTIELLEIARSKDGFKTMQEIGRDMLVSGELSFAEYQRIIMVV
jgi:type IV pilus assembly protein PilB